MHQTLKFRLYLQLFNFFFVVIRDLVATGCRKQQIGLCGVPRERSWSAVDCNVLLMIMMMI